MPPSVLYVFFKKLFVGKIYRIQANDFLLEFYRERFRKTISQRRFSWTVIRLNSLRRPKFLASTSTQILNGAVMSITYPRNVPELCSPLDQFSDVGVTMKQLSTLSMHLSFVTSPMHGRFSVMSTVLISTSCASLNVN